MGIIILIIIIIIIRETSNISKSFRKYRSTVPGNTKSSIYRQQSYWALHKFFGKY